MESAEDSSANSGDDGEKTISGNPEANLEQTNNSDSHNPELTSGKSADTLSVSENGGPSTSEEVPTIKATFKMPIIGPRPQKLKALKEEKKNPNKINALDSIEKIIKSESSELMPDSQDAQDSPQIQTIDKKLIGLPKSNKSPAEKLQDKIIPLPYKEPSWGGICTEQYCFEVLKGGIILNTLYLNNKSFYVFGRLSSCDIILEHPSVSRYHAVIQYRCQGDDSHPAGFYLYDLDSTHGTWLNKNQIKAKCYYRIRVGHMIKFGGSSRMYILQGPDDDQEEESELSVTELKELQKKREEELHRQETAETEKEDKKRKESDSGIDWGMGEDAEEEDDLEENPFALDVVCPNEELYISDPKKTLRGWFEREGYDLSYELEEKGFGHFLCRVQLPLDTASGEPVYAEASIKGKKKEAVIACALEACRTLDRQGLLRQATHESRKRREKNWEEDDFYDSDEDTFLDRTGTIEKKRQQRIWKTKKEEKNPENYDSLLVKYNETLDEIKKIEAELQSQTASEASKSDKAVEDGDDLEAYMSFLQSNPALDKQSRTSLKVRLSRLKQESQRLQRLVNIAKPTALPELKRPEETLADNKNKKSSILSRFLPTSGAMKGHSKNKPLVKPVQQQETKELPDNFEEEEEDELEEKSKNKMEITEQSTSSKNNNDDDLLLVSKRNKEVEEKSKLEEPISCDVTSQSVEKLLPEFSEKIKPKKRESVSEKKDNKKSRKEMKYEYDAANPDYEMWTPPEGQTGDGKTHLNAKYGY